MRNGRETYTGDEMAIYCNGSLAGYADSLTLRVEYDLKEVQIPRVKMMHYKHGVARASGSIGGFLWNKYLQNAALAHLRGEEFNLTIVGRLRNTDTKEEGSVVASGVIFNSADLANWRVGEQVKIEQPFVATSVSLSGFQTPR
ncbi:phage tail tube protein [Exiguobacterium sp. s21]|uniref:phage tail tube protein n=1 Tax=Exiguobacterium sp. s21 TaxID=2751244 RepID=UPI001BE53066|nr:phage tail tube protein [Exiguobacterium sp. s21]